MRGTVMAAASRPPYADHIPYTRPHTTNMQRNPVAAEPGTPLAAHGDRYSPVSPPLPVVHSLGEKTSGSPLICSFISYITLLLNASYSLSLKRQGNHSHVPNPTPGRPQGSPSRSSHMCPISVRLTGHTPPPGRPQGSPLRSPRRPPLQRYGTAHSLIVVFVRAGVVRVRGWDPCGRPGVGRFSTQSSLNRHRKAAPRVQRIVRPASRL